MGARSSYSQKRRGHSVARGSAGCIAMAYLCVADVASGFAQALDRVGAFFVSDARIVSPFSRIFRVLFRLNLLFDLSALLQDRPEDLCLCLADNGFPNDEIEDRENCRVQCDVNDERRGW